MPSQLGDAVVGGLRREKGRSKMTARSRPLVNAVAGLAAVIVLAVIVLGRPSGPGSSPGIGSPGPAGSPLSAPGIAVGDGVVAVGIPVGPLILLVALMAGLAWLGTQVKGRWRVALAGLAVLLLGLVAVVASIDALAFRSGGFAVRPTSTASPDPGQFPDSTDIVMDVGPNELFPVLVTVTNVSPLPITLEGLAERKDLEDAFNAPRFVAIGLPAVPGMLDLNPPDGFHPTTLLPGAEQDVYLLVTAGPCATKSQTVEGRYTLDTVYLAYEVLGVGKIGSVTLPSRIAIPAAAC
jgi:hypothetical protein